MDFINNLIDFLNYESGNYTYLILGIITSLVANLSINILKNMYTKKIHYEYEKEIYELDARNNTVTKKVKLKKIYKDLDDTICNELFSEKVNISKKVLNRFSLLIFIYFIYCIIFDLKIHKIVLSFVLFYCILILLDLILIDYRIEKGYFGTNYIEAKEILYYIKKSNKKNSQTGKKIFKEIKSMDNVKIEEGV